MTAESLSDDQFLYGYLDDYIDGNLSPNDRSRAEKLMSDDSLCDRFKTVRGQLQMNLSRYSLNKEATMALHELVENRTLRETMEAQKIIEVGRYELWGDLRRKIALVFVAVGLIAGIVFWLTPAREKEFPALQYLGYEAIAMEEENRLDLPTVQLAEIREYLASHPGLEFEPKVLAPFGRGWKPEGATVIDYEITKVVAVQYGSEKLDEKLLHFMYAGTLDSLPSSEPFKVGQLVFQTYASDQLNLIAWQISPDTLSFLVGRRSAMELADIAKAGSLSVP